MGKRGLTPVDALLVASVVLFMASLVMPALQMRYARYPGQTEPYQYAMWGWQVLIMGWAGILDRTFAWFANPIWVLALLLIRLKPIAGLLLAAGGLFLACSSLFVTSIWNEPNRETVEGLGIGGYVWVGSFVVAIVAAAIAMRRRVSADRSMLKADAP